MTDVCHLLVVSTIAFTLTSHYVWAPSVSMPRISILLYTPSRVINLVSKKSNKLAKAEGDGVHFVVCVCVCVWGCVWTRGGGQHSPCWPPPAAPGRPQCAGWPRLRGARAPPVTAPELSTPYTSVSAR